MILDDGRPAYFTGPERMSDDSIHQIFKTDKFLAIPRRATTAAGSCHEDAGLPYQEVYYPSGRDAARCSIPMDYDGYESRSQRSRKRRTAPDIHDDIPAATTAKKRSITIGDSQQVWAFYDQCLKACQQNACKIMGKAWVKAVAPKKQSTNAYIKGDSSAPDWWPKRYGPNSSDYVRHKEPDHLLKGERVYLLTHILKLVTECKEKQHPDIRKQGLTVDKLDELARESLSSFFSNNQNTKNAAKTAKKKIYLTEMFRLAKHEESFRRGEIDATCEIMVPIIDKSLEEEDTEENPQAEREEGDNNMCITVSGVSPCRTAPPSMMPSPSSHSPTGALPAPGFANNLPVRAGQYGAGVMTPEMTPEQQSFVTSPAHIHEDASRRASLYSTPATAEYANGLYPAPWQQTTSAPGAAPLYSFGNAHQPAQPLPSPPSTHFVTQPSISINHGPQYMSAPFDGLPTPSTMFRNHSVGHGPVSNAPSYQGFGLPYDARVEHETSAKNEASMSRGSVLP